MFNSYGTKIASVPGYRRFHFDRIYDPQFSQNDAISIIQMGDSICDSGFIMGSHQQFCYEISYIVSGRGWFGTNGQSHTLEPGDIYICKPGEMHNGGVDASDPYRYVYLGFDFNPTLEDGNDYVHIKDLMDLSRNPVCKDRLDLRTPFINALNELSHESRFTSNMIQAYVEQILILTYRNFFSDWEAKYPGEGIDHAKKRAVYSAVHYIDNRLLEIKDPKEIAEALGYSVSYLSHLFLKETGESLRNYYMKRKWKRATELLRDGNHTITQLAHIMQYDSIHTFSRAFRKVYGHSPTQYLREWEQAQSKFQSP